MDRIVSVQPLGLQPIDGASDGQIVTHGNLGLDHDVHRRVQTGVRELHLGTPMVVADEFNALTLVCFKPLCRIRCVERVVLFHDLVHARAR